MDNGVRSADIVKLQDCLTGALIGLARASDTHQASMSTHKAVIEGLYATLANEDLDEKSIFRQIETVRREKDALIPECAACASPCGRHEEYDMDGLMAAREDIRSLKSLILLGLKGMAAYANQALELGYWDENVIDFFYEGLFAIGEDWNVEQLLPVAMKAGEISLRCKELLKKALAQGNAGLTETLSQD